MLVKEKLQNREYFSDIDSRIADYILDMEERLEGTGFMIRFIDEWR